MNMFSRLPLEIMPAKWSADFPHQVKIVTMRSVSVMGWFFPALALNDAASNLIEDAHSVALVVLQRTFVSDHFRPTGKQRNRIVLMSDNE